MKHYNASHRFFVKPGTHYDSETWKERRCAETGILRMNVIDKYSRSRVVFLKEIEKNNLALVEGTDQANPFSELAALVSEGEQRLTDPTPASDPQIEPEPKKPQAERKPGRRKMASNRKPK